MFGDEIGRGVALRRRTAARLLLALALPFGGQTRGAGDLSQPPGARHSAVCSGRRGRYHRAHRGREAQREARPAFRHREHARRRRHCCGTRGVAGAADGYTLALFSNGTAISVSLFGTCRSIRSSSSCRFRRSAISICVFVYQRNSRFQRSAMFSRRRRTSRARSISAPSASAARRTSPRNCSSRWRAPTTSSCRFAPRPTNSSRCYGVTSRWASISTPRRSRLESGKSRAMATRSSQRSPELPQCSDRQRGRCRQFRRDIVERAIRAGRYAAGDHRQTQRRLA